MGNADEVKRTSKSANFHPVTFNGNNKLNPTIKS
jgi:hypothetical protein